MTRLAPLHIAVLHGGPTSEHDISVWSSRGVLEALRGRGHRCMSVYVDKQGLWHLSEADAGATVSQPMTSLAAVAQLQTDAVDVAFLGFHGTYGEDGRIQALLDLAEIRYTGSGMTATAVAMDKPLARRVFAGAGIDIARAVELSTQGLDREGVADREAERVVEALGVPLVIKVPAGGSSIGVEIVRHPGEVSRALRRLGVGVSHLLCEQFIAGVEVTAGVIESLDGRVECLPVVEIVPVRGEFFDYEAKYQQGATDEIVPARLDPETTARVQQLGRRAHEVLGCRGVSRTDMIVGQGGRVVVLETNTLPGLTPASLLPKAAAAAGYDYASLLERFVAVAIG